MTNRANNLLFIGMLLLLSGCAENEESGSPAVREQTVRTEPAGPWDDPESFVRYMALDWGPRVSNVYDAFFDLERITALTQTGETAKALEVIQHPEFLTSSGLERMCDALNEQKDLQPLIDVAHNIEIPLERATTLCYIARVSFRRDDLEQAYSLLEDAEKCISELDNKYTSASVLAEMTRTLVIANEHQRAAEFLQKAVQESRQIENQPDLAYIRSVIATLASDLGDQPFAERELREAANLVSEIEDPAFAQNISKAVAHAMAECGEYQLGLEFANRIENGVNSAAAFSVIAESLLSAGDKDQAAEFLNAALVPLKRAEHAEYPYSIYARIKVICKIASGFVKVGESDRANELLSRALEASREIEFKDTRWTSLQSIAGVYAEANERDRALDVFTNAAELAFSDDDEYSKTIGLTCIAAEMVRSGLIDEGTDWLKRAQDASSQLEYDRGHYLRMISCVWAEAGDIEQSISFIKTMDDYDARVNSLWVLSTHMAYEPADHPDDFMTVRLIPRRLSHRTLKKSFTAEERETARILVEEMQQYRDLLKKYEKEIKEFEEQRLRSFFGDPDESPSDERE